MSAQTTRTNLEKSYYYSGTFPSFDTIVKKLENSKFKGSKMKNADILVFAVFFGGATYDPIYSFKSHFYELLNSGCSKNLSSEAEWIGTALLEMLTVTRNTKPDPLKPEALKQLRRSDSRLIINQKYIHYINSESIPKIRKTTKPVLSLSSKSNGV